jgi:hypothetical protein
MPKPFVPGNSGILTKIHMENRQNAVPEFWQPLAGKFTAEPLLTLTLSVYGIDVDTVRLASSVWHDFDRPAWAGKRAGSLQ